MKVHDLLTESEEARTPEWKKALVAFAKGIVSDSKKLVGLELTYDPEEGDTLHTKVTKVDFFSDYHCWSRDKGTKGFFDPENYNTASFADRSCQKKYGMILTLDDGLFMSLGGTIDIDGEGFVDSRFIVKLSDIYPDIAKYGNSAMAGRGLMAKASKKNATWAQIVQKAYPELKAKLETELAIAAAKKRHAVKRT